MSKTLTIRLDVEVPDEVNIFTDRADLLTEAAKGAVEDKMIPFLKEYVRVRVSISDGEQS